MDLSPSATADEIKEDDMHCAWSLRDSMVAFRTDISLDSRKDQTVFQTFPSSESQARASDMWYESMAFPNTKTQGGETAMSDFEGGEERIALIIVGT